MPHNMKFGNRWFLTNKSKNQEPGFILGMMTTACISTDHIKLAFVKGKSHLRSLTLQPDSQFTFCVK